MILLLLPRPFPVALLLLLGVVGGCQASLSLSKNSQFLFDKSMGFLDTVYDPEMGYLFDFEGGAAMRHNTRSSAWYALGLLARNSEDQENDVGEADKIIRNVIAGQFDEDSGVQWYGTYQKYPEEPSVGSEAYASSIYNSWDPNWRDFVGTTLVVIMEEFSGLLSNETQELILGSLHVASVGNSYRVGGVDGDNLYPSYSNPAIMRAFLSGWTGRKTGDQNMTDAGEQYAREIIDLFDKTNTLSEFNSPTYTGVNVYALLLWSRYLPPNSIMAEKGPDMLSKTWSTVSQLWNPNLKNLAGPWDRAYGYDMNRYVSVISLFIWSFVGRETSSLYSNPAIMSHIGDYALGPVAAVLAQPMLDIILSSEPSFLETLTTFQKEHTYTAQAWYPPYDKVVRNITTWVSESLTVGGESFDQTELGGPSGQAIPAVVQWLTGGGGGKGEEVGFLLLNPTEKSLQADILPGERGKLNLTYPSGNASSKFELLVSTFRDKTTIQNWSDLPGLSVSVSGNVDLESGYDLAFGGEIGGEEEAVNDFEYWKFTYGMPEGFQGVPNLVLELEIKE